MSDKADVGNSLMNWKKLLSKQILSVDSQSVKYYYLLYLFLDKLNINCDLNLQVSC